MVKHLNIGNKQNSWKKIREIAIWPLRVYNFQHIILFIKKLIELKKINRKKLIELNRKLIELSTSFLGYFL